MSPQIRLCLCATLIAVPAAVAQVTSPTSQPASEADQVQRLSPFEVQADSTHGYVASESTTGTRVRTKIADLPFSVNVVTQEFLKDFDIFDLSGPDLGYVSNLSGVDSQGNFNMRGFAASFYLWNGFYRLGLIDRSDVEELDVIKGNNAAIYGQTSPAGMLNIVTKNPTWNPLEDLTFTAGSYSTRRIEGDWDLALAPWAANRTSFGGMDRTYDTPYAWLHQRLFSDGFIVKLGATTLVTKVEWSKRTSDPVSGEQMFLYSSAAKAYTGGLAPLSASLFSQDGPNATANRELTSINEILEHPFSDNVSLRLSAYAYARHAYNFDTGISNEYDPNLAEVVGISTKPLSDRLNEDGGAGQADLFIHWSLLNEAIKNTTLVTLDYSQNWRYRQQLQVPSTISLSAVQLISAPNYAFPNVNLFTIPTRDDKVRWDTDGIFLRNEADLLEDKLKIFAGVRFDNVEYNLDFGNQLSTKAPYPIATAGQVQHYYDDALDPQIGYNYRVTKTLGLYSSYSESFFPNAQNAKLGNPPLGDQRGRGFDYGVKVDLLGDRLQFTLGGFYINQTGVKVTITNPDGSTDTVPQGSENSKGVEFDGSYQLTNRLFMQASYGYTDARLTNQGNDVIALGLRPASIPVDNGSVVARYSFPGLRGLTWLAGATYTGVSYPETGASTVAEAHLHLPSYTLCTTGLTYEWTQVAFGLKLTQSVRLVVKNLFDKRFSDPTLVIGDRRAFYVSYELRH